ncbi:uncharacterized protein PHACADRAFT_257108 [Phanerochaete carnosa HHB-10118-sp]|uniref:Uncharacterized protein n=1 Tax=Phanerochaete carnosa (strain HHB-10118-sp) TaxID=650164 RepID=K5V0Q5_PHACS|nr:uncharacterized protein PHACADRAFT_257108 [Phanerochaete carnosa HHB-10118-sp]EKM56061.1 hypothetical protein PHACADRAFT_257108 [Phanerochaete carnosa HHB-10118-sp]
MCRVTTWATGTVVIVLNGPIIAQNLGVWEKDSRLYWNVYASSSAPLPVSRHARACHSSASGVKLARGPQACWRGSTNDPGRHLV